MIKHHLFIAVHHLDRFADIGEATEIRRFDANLEIALAWRRLTAGESVAIDRQLLKHEAAEAWYMRKHGPSYSTAHNAAHRRFPSPLETIRV